MPRYAEHEAPFEELRNIVQTFVDKFPDVFTGFRVEDVGFVLTKEKKSSKKNPIKVHKVKYPQSVFSDKTYIFEVLDTKWENLDQKRRNLAVFHVMCSIPVEGFDPDSKEYGSTIKPDFELYRAEYAAAGGVADWFDDNRARDPMEMDNDGVLNAVYDVDSDSVDDPIPATSSKDPVTNQDIMDIDTQQQAAS